MRVKKALCLVLSVLMIAAVLIVPVSSSDENGMTIPTVYVPGQGFAIARDPGKPTQKILYSGRVPLPSDTYIQDTTKKLIPMFLKAAVTGQTDEYVNEAKKAFLPIYEDIRFDENGNRRDNSEVVAHWKTRKLKDSRLANGEYALDSYTFRWDWRLDPFALAEDLNEYIDAVLRVTGAEKVNLVGRCLGSAAVLAYLTKYGGEKIKKVVFYSPTAYGDVVFSKIISGKFNADPKALDKFLSDNPDFLKDKIKDQSLVEYITTTVSYLANTHQLDIPTYAIKATVNKFVPLLLPELAMGSYGSFPSYWSMTLDEDYEDAKRLVFSGREEKYRGFIEKIDNYHYNVQVKLPQTLDSLKRQGVKIMNISKYGFQIMPIIEGSDRAGDEFLDLYSSSFGATSAKAGRKLSYSYIKKARGEGRGKYISPDRMVDMSTAMLPDTTWAIKNLQHRLFPNSVDVLIDEFLRSPDFNTKSDPKFPMYMIYTKDGDVLTPMTSGNGHTESWSENPFEPIIRFFKMVINIINILLSKTGLKFRI